jgi:diguanylate cyclase (GGDEF)-like protein
MRRALVPPRLIQRTMAQRLLLSAALAVALLPPLLWLGFVAWTAQAAPTLFIALSPWHSLGVVAGISVTLATALWLAAIGPALQKLHRAQRLLKKRGLQDGLTGLLNRDGLRAALNLTLARAAQRLDLPRQVGLVMIDLDRFHLINDSLGQAAGDAVLRTAAHRIQAVVRQNDALARLSADRFVVLVSGTADAATLAAMARNLLRTFVPPCQVDGHEIVLTPSLGSACTTDQVTSVDDVLKCAELALRAAKVAGGGCARHFDPSLMEQHDRRLDLEARLRQALHAGHFVLAYQPILSSQHRTVVGVEALLRWPQAPHQRQVSPADFVPVLEETGLIVPVGRWVLREACAQGFKWLAAGAQDLVLSVNVSPRQFMEADFSLHVAQALADTRFPAHRLQIEVTEGLLLDPSAATLAKLEQLVRTGVRLAVDDFGVGHSSLAYLKTFPLHTLKIDRLFVKDLEGNPRDVAIARAIIELGHSLGLKVTAEGVETEHQAQTLQRLGCDSLQGFLFSRAVGATQFSALLNDFNGQTDRGQPRASHRPEWANTMTEVGTC